MPIYDHKGELEKIKELICFYDTVRHLPVPAKRAPQQDEDTRIPVILSADNNYSCFVAITGASILYNTHSFIEFYILSEGISEENKAHIRQTFSAITSHYSVQFVECDSKEYFSSIRLPENYHIRLNTCNRLLFPLLVPQVKRAIYLDVDLILLGDIKELWEVSLDGYLFAAAASYVNRNSEIKTFKQVAHIPLKDSYFHFNSGVMVFDYEKWRQQAGSSQKIIDQLMALLAELSPQVTPDEILLNAFAYRNGGYKLLAHKYNVNPYYSYLWLKKNKSHLPPYEAGTLHDYEQLLQQFTPQQIELTQEPLVRHFFGHEKPWNSFIQKWFPIPATKHFEDFWFYASLTPFFEELKNDFIMRKMITSAPLHRSHFWRDYWNYCRCKLLAKIMWGHKRKYYKERMARFHQRVCWWRENLKK